MKYRIYCNEQFRTECRFLRCPFSTADGQGTLAKGRPYSGPLVEQNDEFVKQPSHGHHENGRRCSVIYWSGACSRKCDKIVCSNQISDFKSFDSLCARRSGRYDSATVVETSSGRIRGFERNGVCTFPPYPCFSGTSEDSEGATLEKYRLDGIRFWE